MEFRLGEETPFLDIVYDHSGLTNSEIEALKQYYSQSEETIATTGTNNPENQDFSIRRSKVVWMTEDFNQEFKTHDLLYRIYNRVDEINRMTFKFNIHTVEPLQITRYESSNQGHYDFHFDAGILQGNITRKLSFVIQLSDPSEFEGGEFVIGRSGKETVINEEHPQAIQKGMIIIFPSFLLHGVKPVTKGTRFSLVGWCLGERFK